MISSLKAGSVVRVTNHGVFFYGPDDDYFRPSSAPLPGDLLTVLDVWWSHDESELVKVTVIDPAGSVGYRWYHPDDLSGDVTLVIT